MKRRLTQYVTIVMVLGLLSLAACGGSDDDGATTTESDSNTTTTNASEDASDGGSEAESGEGSSEQAASSISVTEVEVPEPSEDYLLGAAMVSGGEPFQESVVWAMKDEAEKYGAEMIVVDAGGYGNAAKQASQIEDLVQRGVDAIILWPVAFEGSAPPVDAAAEAGVPVVTVVTPSASEEVSSWVGVDDSEIGEKIARHHGEALGGSGKVALVNGGEGAAWSNFRADGYVETMQSEFPDIEVVDQQWTTALDPGTALDLAEDLLLKYPDLSGIYCTTTTMAFGASQAVDSVGKTGEVLLASSSIQGKDDINLLKEGKVAVVTGEPAIITGRWGVDYTIKVLEGEEVPGFVPVPTPVYTQDNIDEADFSLELAPEYLE